VLHHAGHAHAQHAAPGVQPAQGAYGDEKVANNRYYGLARRDREWSLNDGQIPNRRVIRVHVSTGYHRVEGNRRASCNGPVSDLPPETPTSRFATCMYRPSEDLSHPKNSDPPHGGMFGSAGAHTPSWVYRRRAHGPTLEHHQLPHGRSTHSLTRPAGYTGDELTGRLWNTTSRHTAAPLTHSHAQLGIPETSSRADSGTPPAASRPLHSLTRATFSPLFRCWPPCTPACARSSSFPTRH
jgi:hypothetical protein